MRLPIAWYAVACLLLSVVGCGQGAESPDFASPLTPVTAKPPKPLTIPVPTPPSSDHQGTDLSKEDGHELASFARNLATEQSNPKEAVTFEYWAVKAGAGSMYDLACWTAMAGDLDAAFYWLQEAALADGVDAEWATEDADLASLRKDRRWRQVGPFLRTCNAYWKTSGLVQTVVVLPTGYQVGTPISAVVAMHGLGSTPDNMIDPVTFQPIADELNTAFVGVSGTYPKGARSFVWSEDPTIDAAHLDKALAGLADRLTIKPGHRIAMGFSQGGQLGFEVAFQHPEQYRGAIVMSPGTRARYLRLDALKPSTKNQGQGFVCLCGAGELPGNIANTKQDADFAEKAKARVFVRITQGQPGHSFPPDFVAMIARWVRFVDGTDPHP